MGLFKKIGDFFSTKDLEEKPKETTESLHSVESAKNVNEPKISEVKQVNKSFVCTSPNCGQTIDAGEHWSKCQGKFYHKQCLKEIKRML